MALYFVFSWLILMYYVYSQPTSIWDSQYKMGPGTKLQTQVLAMMKHTEDNIQKVKHQILMEIEKLRGEMHKATQQLRANHQELGSMGTPAEPIGLWPMNSRYGLSDVIGGRNGTGHNVTLDSNARVDLSGIKDKLPERLRNAYEDQSYQFAGTSSSYVQIPNIPMENDFTYLSFVRAEIEGPIWQWDPPGAWGDHVWVTKDVGTTESLFFRPIVRPNTFGTAIRIYNLPLNSWTLVGVSWQRSTGRAVLFINGRTNSQRGLLDANSTHNTAGDIRIGKAKIDDRAFRGGIFCAALYNTFIDDLNSVNWDLIVEKCFKTLPV